MGEDILLHRHLDGDDVGKEGAALGGGLDLRAVKTAFPAVGIADLDAHGVELLHGLGLGFGAHPVLRQNALLCASAPLT